MRLTAATPFGEHSLTKAVSSAIVLSMRKLRRKSEIRARAVAELGFLRDRARAKASFVQPRGGGWHEVFLGQLASGQTIETAAKAATISRAGVRWAAQHNPRFAAAYDRAYAAGLKARYKASRGQNATNGWTMNWGS
jgi:hypothetical protein